MSNTKANWDFIRKLIDKAHLSDNYDEAVEALVFVFPKSHIESLRLLVDGPVHDGDVISKRERDDLIDMGIGIRVCYKGEQGFTGAKYIGYSILKAIDNRNN